MMGLALKTDLSEYKNSEVRNAVSFALTSAYAQANQRFKYYATLCRQFEQEFKLSSSEFMQKFENGEVGDEEQYFDWYAAKRGFDIWHERREILSGVSV